MLPPFFLVSSELVPPPPSTSTLVMGRDVTLVGKRLCWSDAVLYCRDFHWDLLSIRGPEEQEMIQQLVARAPFPPTSHLWVGLRRYFAVFAVPYSSVYQANKSVCPYVRLSVYLSI